MDTLPRMSEKDVENAVIHYFRKAGFNCLPDRRRGWKKFCISDDIVSEPDIVAFKWDKHGLMLNVIGIECKKNGSNAAITGALAQVKSYQRHFPWCYIATAKSTRASKNDLEYLKKHHNVGYIPVDMKTKPASVIVSDILDTYPGYLNHNLSLLHSDASRQKLIMLDIFIEKFRNISFNFKDEFGWIWTDGDVQYQISNYNTQRSIQFGINIENRRAIEHKVKGRLSSLTTWLKEPEFRDFKITFRRKEYPPSRPMTPTSSTILQKVCSDFNFSDADALESKMEEYEYRIQLLIQKIIWNQDDILFRRDYINRVSEVKTILDNLRKALRW